MSKPTLEQGFTYWREEVEHRERPEVDVPYIPVVALVGLYAALHPEASEMNSYCWRQRVLSSADAMQGLRQSLMSYHKDRLDDDFLLSIGELEPDEGVSGQHHWEHQSIIDGLPSNTDTIVRNEWFLARTLGFAGHDYLIHLRPLRLYDQGPLAVANYYPLTAALVEEYS